MSEKEKSKQGGALGRFFRDFVEIMNTPIVLDHRDQDFSHQIAREVVEYCVSNKAKNIKQLQTMLSRAFNSEPAAIASIRDLLPELLLVDLMIVQKSPGICSRLIKLLVVKDNPLIAEIPKEVPWDSLPDEIRSELMRSPDGRTALRLYDATQSENSESVNPDPNGNIK